MAPGLSEYCSKHSDLMQDVGEIKANQKNHSETLRCIKETLDRWEDESRTEAIAAVERKVKVKLIWGGLGTVAVAGISAGVNFLIKKIYG